MTDNAENLFTNYSNVLTETLLREDWRNVHSLARRIVKVKTSDNRILLCGNGGSAANATHIANDLLYAVTGGTGHGLDVMSLNCNSAVVTCLANDVSYQNVFSEQIKVFGRSEDLLIVLSGSGNSENIIQALKTARALGMHSAGIFGFDGGKCLSLTDFPIHFSVNDMQIAEDIQLIVGHMIMKYVKAELFNS